MITPAAWGIVVHHVRPLAVTTVSLTKARLVNRERGPAVTAVLSYGSADLASAGHADGVMLLPPDQTPFAAGQLVAFRPWRPLS